MSRASASALDTSPACLYNKRMKLAFRLLFAAACSFVVTLCLPVLAQAATLNVPAQYATIQSAVNAASNGDTVLIADGTYTGLGNVDIDFGGKNLTITSQHGPDSTIIECEGSTDPGHRGFYLHSGETTALISGLTIRNGDTIFTSGVPNSGSGSGIETADSNLALTVQNCIIDDCLVDNDGLYNESGGIDDEGGGSLTLTGCQVLGNSGSGIFTSGVSVALTGCTIAGNGYGGGLAAAYGSITVTNCLFVGNTRQGSAGGAIYSLESNLSAINCTFVANYGQSIGGIETDTGSTTLTNDILYGDTGGEIQTEDGGTVTVNYCDIQGGFAGTGNLNADPLFEIFSDRSDMPLADFHLQSASPCLGAGTPTGAPATTIDSQTRPTPPSIGAYEEAVVPVIPSHVLWDNTSGAASIWNYNPASGTFTQNTYGPYTNWTAKAVADGPDDLTRVLWDNTDGRMSLWSLNNATAAFTQYTFGPYGGWTATALSVGQNYTTRVLWDNADGRASIWDYETTTGTFTQNTYGPYPGWTAVGIAVGPDGLTRVLWNNVNGETSIWSLNNATAAFTQYTFVTLPRMGGSRHFSQQRQPFSPNPHSME